MIYHIKGAKSFQLRKVAFITCFAVDEIGFRQRGKWFPLHNVRDLSIFFNIDIYIDTNVNATRKLNATIVARLSPGYMVNIVVSC